MAQQLVVEVPDEVAVCWRAMAMEAEVPLEVWMAWCCIFASTMGLPINEAILGQPPVERELAGVAWEVRSHMSLERMPRGGLLDNTVPIVDVRTGIRRKTPWLSAIRRPDPRPSRALREKALR